MEDEKLVSALLCCGNTDTKRPDCEQCPLQSTRMCVKVMLEGAAESINEKDVLRAQLAESERQRVPAVEEIPHICQNCGKRHGWDTCKEAAFVAD